MLCKTVLIDDHPLFRKGVAELLEDCGQFTVTAQYDRCQSFLSQLDHCQADLILLDLHIPDGNGLSVLKEIKSQDPSTKVVMLTASDDNQNLLDAIRSGADGYLLKDSDPDLLIKKLDELFQGKIALSEDTATLLAQGLVLESHSKLESNAKLNSLATENYLSLQSKKTIAESPNASAPVSANSASQSIAAHYHFTEREQQTLLLIAQGLNNKLIARKMGISDGTVKVYVKNLLQKLELHSRLELAAWAHKHQFA